MYRRSLGALQGALRHVFRYPYDAHGDDPIQPSDSIVEPPRRSVSSAFDVDTQYALEVHAEAFVSEHYTSGRSQLEAKRYIREPFFSM